MHTISIMIQGFINIIKAIFFLHGSIYELLIVSFVLALLIFLMLKIGISSAKIILLGIIILLFLIVLIVLTRII